MTPIPDEAHDKGPKNPVVKPMTGLDMALLWIVGLTLAALGWLLWSNLSFQRSYYGNVIASLVPSVSNRAAPGTAVLSVKDAPLEPWAHAVVLSYARAMDFAVVKTSVIFLGFILTMLGALYVLRVQQSAFSLEVQAGKETKGALNTASPGLVMVAAGILTVNVGLLKDSRVDFDLVKLDSRDHPLKEQAVLEQLLDALKNAQEKNLTPNTDSDKALVKPSAAQGNSLAGPEREKAHQKSGDTSAIPNNADVRCETVLNGSAPSGVAPFKGGGTRPEDFDGGFVARVARYLTCAREGKLLMSASSRLGEFGLAESDRRQKALLDALVAAGAPAALIHTGSQGKELPDLTDEVHVSYVPAKAKGPGVRAVRLELTPEGQLGAGVDAQLNALVAEIEAAGKAQGSKQEGEIRVDSFVSPGLENLREKARQQADEVKKYLEEHIPGNGYRVRVNTIGTKLDERPEIVVTVEPK